LRWRIRRSAAGATRNSVDRPAIPIQKPYSGINAYFAFLRQDLPPWGPWLGLPYPPPDRKSRRSNCASVEPSEMIETAKLMLRNPAEFARRRPYVQLFLASFSILFLELVLIRWVPAYVRMFGYFTNFILFGALVGAGVGILTCTTTRVRLPSLASLLLALVVCVLANQFTMDVPTTEVLFYGAGERAAARENYWVIPLIFALVALVFVPLGRVLGGLLQDLPPLRAYAVDIAGSLAGIAAFALLSYFSLQPFFWFALFMIVMWPLVPGSEKLSSALAWSAVLGCVLYFGISDIWSPYYRIVVAPTSKNDGYLFWVNNIGHQQASPHRFRENFYFRPYELLGQTPYRRVLIIGAGTGTDVAVALANGVEHVDAVEIDPELYRLGRELHPDHPYDDPRVSVHIDDGRAFIRHTNQTYDLIVFALTDSLTLTSSHANLRLESFLFTTESMRQARAHLTDQGVLVLYNYYRQDWSIRKLAGMLETAFEAPPYVSTYGDWGRAAAFMAGPRLSRLAAEFDRPYSEPPAITTPDHHQVLPVIGEGRLSGDSSVTPASDDWPFVYMIGPGLPNIYLMAIAMAALTALGMIGSMTPGVSLRQFDWHFFFLGAAFMLLETRSLVTFSLLFGTTWMVNALVFFAILSSVLLAVLINTRLRLEKSGPLYGLLFATLAVAYLVPTETVLGIESGAVRYLVASLMAFAPIFVANVVFSRSFRETGHPDIAFASNLVGIMAGGLVEYVALAAGYRALLIPVAAFYGIALVLTRVRRLRVLATQAG
jgi:SAM-dependent methyltransferase